MYVYRNTSRSKRTFYGVEFGPGEAHSVPGYINDSKFVRVNDVVEPKKSEPKVVKAASNLAKSSDKKQDASTTKADTNKVAKEEKKSNG